jgi:hypothetical protein
MPAQSALYCCAGFGGAEKLLKCHAAREACRTFSFQGIIA